jgi:hypothetical protein
MDTARDWRGRTITPVYQIQLHLITGHVIPLTSHPDGEVAKFMGENLRRTCACGRVEVVWSK